MGEQPKPNSLLHDLRPPRRSTSSKTVSRGNNMNQESIKKVLDNHKLWLDGRTKGVQADLRRADLRSANLTQANLTQANLAQADLRGADLRGADLDFACFPLWCGGLNFKVDEKIARQLLYHLLSIAQTSELLPELFTPEIVAEANKFHRVGEVPEIKLEETK